MIPRDYITAWRAQAPWIQDFQVEQDLVISRALVQIFSHPLLRKSLAFRGGTALYKLYIKPPARYSEDIDLVQINAEPAGPMMDGLRETLGSWLEPLRWKQTEASVTFVYRFASEDTPPLDLRPKIEINSREHFTAFGFVQKPFRVSSPWFEGACEICTYELDELLGTKLRALYQRKKGRDLFDLALALKEPDTNPDRIIAAFFGYMQHGGHAVSRAQFEQNLEAKMQDPQFLADISPLLADGYEWDIDAAARTVQTQLIEGLP